MHSDCFPYTFYQGFASRMLSQKAGNLHHQRITIRKLPPYKKISDFTLRKEPFEKNAQQKIKRFLYKEYENA